jgi:hypothetical protein
MQGVHNPPMDADAANALAPTPVIAASANTRTKKRLLSFIAILHEPPNRRQVMVPGNSLAIVCAAWQTACL